MPADVASKTHIQPCYRLPKNEMRQADGGRRFLSNLEEKDRPSPVISVVTVVLNGEEFLEKTIQSVISQLGQENEYIIIDGGSSDSTINIIKNYNDKIEYWVSEPDQGISDAFNKGIALSRGKVIGVLNAGDWYEPGIFSQVKKFFQENEGADVLCGSVQYWHGEEKAYISESRPEFLGREMSVTHPTCFVLRELYLRYGGFDPDYEYAMDYELLLRLQSNNVGIHAVPQVLANMSHEGISEQNWQKALVETWKARRRYVPDSFFAGRLYLWYLIIRKWIRFCLQMMGMHGVVRFYRERLAPVKKRLSR